MASVEIFSQVWNHSERELSVMQTFLPYPSFTKSAECLDRQRLGKQRVECVQILETLTGVKQGWKNHPAVKMWSGHEGMLCLYGIWICDEWINRGYKDTCKDRIHAIMNKLENNQFMLPSFFGNDEFHLSHQSNLVRKNPDFYGPKFPGVPADLPYVWPV